MEPEDSLPTTGPYLQPDDSSPQFLTLFLEDPFTGTASQVILVNRREKVYFHWRLYTQLSTY